MLSPGAMGLSRNRADTYYIEMDCVCQAQIAVLHTVSRVDTPAQAQHTAVGSSTVGVIKII